MSIAKTTAPARAWMVCAEGTVGAARSFYVYPIWAISAGAAQAEARRQHRVLHRAPAKFHAVVAAEAERAPHLTRGFLIGRLHAFSDRVMSSAVMERGCK